MLHLLLLLLATLISLVQARTDLSGCTSSISGASLIWYVPGTGELCEFLDCGGGRGPPKTTVPGCAGYSGTATYSPSYLTGFQQAAATPIAPTDAITTVDYTGGTSAPMFSFTGFTGITPFTTASSESSTRSSRSTRSTRSTSVNSGTEPTSTATTAAAATTATTATTGPTSSSATVTPSATQTGNAASILALAARGFGLGAVLFLSVLYCVL